MPIARSIGSMIHSPLSRAIADAVRGGGRPVQPGDYLMIGDDYLADENGNRLTG